MYIETLTGLEGEKLNLWENFLRLSKLTPDARTDKTVLIWDDGKIIASGSRKGNLIKCVAVDAARQGEGLTAKLMTAISQDAFDEGCDHLFLYTKPENEDIFSSLFFYPVASTADVLLMENKRSGISKFINTLPKIPGKGVVGSVVMNCNPFTLGHRYLIENAAKECDHLCIFAVSEDKSEFSFEDRFNMILKGTAHLENVTVMPTGPYLISSASFPDYFLKDRDEEKVTKIHCLLDIEIFVKYYVPAFSISKRFVGTEPMSYTTNCYNMALKENLPKSKVELIEIPRLEKSGTPISASKVRELIKNNEIEKAKAFLPQITIEYLAVTRQNGG